MPRKMALNPGAVGRRTSDGTEADEAQAEGGEPPKNSATTSATANQNGDQPGCRDGVTLMPEQEAPERRRSSLQQTDSRSYSSSPLPGQRPNFQIPRKIRERKGGAAAMSLQKAFEPF